MVAGEVCRGFFQELVFHLQFPVFPLGLAQPRPLAYGERRFFAGMVTAVGGDPVTEGAFVYSELLGYSGDRTRCLDHHFHGFVLVFRREALLRSWQNFTLSRSSILMDGLSGKSGAPHIPIGGERGSNAITAFLGAGLFQQPSRAQAVDALTTARRRVASCQARGE